MPKALCVFTQMVILTHAISLFPTQLEYILPSVLDHANIYNHSSFSVISVAVDHSGSTKWVIPPSPNSSSSFSGWNMSQTDKCHLRFLAVALQSHDPEYRGTGRGNVTIVRQHEGSATIECYFVTNRKKDFPQTVSIAVVCPVQHDHIAESICSYTSQRHTDMFLSLQYHVPEDTSRLQSSPRVTSSSVRVRSLNSRIGKTNDTITSPPTRHMKYLDQLERHAVCTVQVFRNKLTSARLFLFVSYYLRMGWTVIVYDRLGLHRDVIAEFGDNVQLNYYPFTVFQILFPEMSGSHSRQVRC